MEQQSPLITETEAVKLLKAELQRRCHENPRYSLRAFARFLGISHTVLSLVFSGKRPLSRRARLLIADRLALPAEVTASWMEEKKQVVSSQRHASQYQFIDLETFSLISDWVHYAILSLLDVEGAIAEPRWIAKRLNINESLAKISFERLAEIGLIHQVDGVWKQSGKAIKVENKVSTAVTRRFQTQLLHKALESLERDPVEARDFSSMTLAIDPQHINYAKERIRQFRRDLTAELEAKGRPKEVYNLTVQIYPVSAGELV